MRVMIAPMTSISAVFRLDNDDIHICFKLISLGKEGQASE